MTNSDIAIFLPSFAGTTMIALVHVLIPRFGFMRKPGNLWLPASAGVAMAYVFMDIFPHLAKSQAKLANIDEQNFYEFLTHHVYLIGLVGFIVYLGVAQLSTVIRKSRTGTEITVKSAPLVLQVEVASLAAYNFLIGYLLSEQATHRVESSLFLGLAMAIHFIGVDYTIRDHFTRLYDRLAGIVFAVSVYAGWIVGVTLEVADATLALWYAFLAGGLIVLATIYELPRIRSRLEYGSFIAGCAVFSAIVLIEEHYM